jgi:hypothetical protein
MKKVLYFAALLFCAGIISCEKEDIGGTATEDMAGEWYVTVDAADESGNLFVDADGDSWEDPFGMGRVNMITSNTAANSATELMVDDLGNFWQFRVKTVADPSGLTFASAAPANANDTINNLNGDDIWVTITGGKIMKGAGRQNNGSVADSIVFYVSFSDDPNPARYGYAKYRVSGIRYSGLAEND